MEHVAPDAFVRGRSLPGTLAAARGADECVRPYVIPVVGTCSRISHLFSDSCIPAWQNLAMQFYRRNLPDLQRDFKPHFITFVTKFRWVVSDWARDIVLSSCCHDHRKQYELYVAVVWQEESFDHVLRCSEGLDAKVEYVLQNPVRKGLVADWREYPWNWQRGKAEEAEMTIRTAGLGQNT